MRIKSEKEEKDVVYYFIFDPTRKRDSGQGERAPSSKCSIKSQKKNGKNERNLKKNLEESFAKASALASPHTRARAQRTDELERHEQETALSVFVVCELRERLC